MGIAELAGGEWPDKSRAAAKTLSEGDDSEDGAAVMLLADIKEIFGDNDRIRSEFLVASLINKEDRPWPEWRRGKPITTRQVAKLLKPFHIIPGTIRLEAGDTAKGYYRSKFEDAFTRYLADPGVLSVTTSQPTESGALSDFRSVTPETLVTDTNRLKPAEYKGCDVVTDRKGGSGEDHHDQADFESDGARQRERI